MKSSSGRFAFCLALGAGAGAALGAAIHDPAKGVAIGMAIGTGLWAVWSAIRGDRL
jgi:hypothetical protein